jgi:hypothetical protein
VPPRHRAAHHLLTMRHRHPPPTTHLAHAALHNVPASAQSAPQIICRPRRSAPRPPPRPPRCASRHRAVGWRGLGCAGLGASLTHRCPSGASCAILCAGLVVVGSGMCTGHHGIYHPTCANHAPCRSPACRRSWRAQARPQQRCAAFPFLPARLPRQPAPHTRSFSFPCSMLSFPCSMPRPTVCHVLPA